MLNTDHAQGKKSPGQNSEEGCHVLGREEKDAKKTENEFPKGRMKTSPENTEVKGEKYFILSIC